MKGWWLRMATLDTTLIRCCCRFIYLFEDFRHFYDMDDNKKAPIRNGRMSDICAPAAAVHYFCCFQTTSHVQSTVNLGWRRMEMAKNSSQRLESDWNVSTIKLVEWSTIKVQLPFEISASPSWHTCQPPPESTVSPLEHIRFDRKALWIVWWLIMDGHLSARLVWWFRNSFLFPFHFGWTFCFIHRDFLIKYCWTSSKATITKNAANKQRARALLHGIWRHSREIETVEIILIHITQLLCTSNGRRW